VGYGPAPAAISIAIHIHIISFCFCFFICIIFGVHALGLERALHDHHHAPSWAFDTIIYNGFTRQTGGMAGWR
jgi:hypothetical protein